MSVAQEKPVPPEAVRDNASQTTILKKLNDIIVPRIEFEDVSLEEAVDFLRTKSVEMDGSEEERASKGVGFVIRKAPGAAGGHEDVPRVTELRLSKVPLGSILKYVCMATNHRLAIGERAIEISPAVNGDLGLAGQVDAEAKAALEQKIKQHVVSMVDFAEVSLDEAVAFLRYKTKEKGEGNGINFIIMRKPGDKEPPRIKELSLRNQTVESLLQKICDQSKQRFIVHEAAIIISPMEEKQTP
jgi:bla regulator protein blaR1